MIERPAGVSRATFLRSAAGVVVGAFVSPAAFAQPHAAHAHAARKDLEHPDPREGITAERVLTPEALGKFNKGKVGQAYQSAREHPEVFDGIACACSCGGKKGTHRSLLSCFESMQATGCGACQEEAEVVMKGIAEGNTLAEIRAAVDKWAD